MIRIYDDAGNVIKRTSTRAISKSGKMWELISRVSQWPLWNFLSIVGVVWITQRLIAWRERRTKLADVQREAYLATIPHSGRIL